MFAMSQKNAIFVVLLKMAIHTICIINNKEILNMSEQSKNETLDETDKVQSAEVVEVPKTGNGETTTSLVSEPDTQEKQESTSNLNVPTTITSTDLQKLDYTDFSTPARMLALAEVLVKSQLVPLKKSQDVMTALMTGKELGLPFITSISQIYPINGRPTLGVHLKKALCIKHGVHFEKIEDAIPIYAFAKADAEGKTLLHNNKPIIIGKGTIEEQPENTTKAEIDKRTTYKLSRMMKMADGSYKELTGTGSFTISEAKEAELSEKDVWKKYWRRMLDARAFGNAVGEVADDVVNGLRSPSELDPDNFYINADGKEVIVPKDEITEDITAEEVG